MHVLYSVFIADGIWRCETIRLFEFYTFHFMECNLVVEEEPTRKSMTVAALILSSYLTPFVILSM